MRSFVYWCQTVKEWSRFPDKKHYRAQVRYWLDIDATRNRPNHGVHTS